MDAFHTRRTLGITARFYVHYLLPAILTCSGPIHEGFIQLSHGVLLKSLSLLTLQHLDDLVLLLGVDSPGRKYARS